MELAVEKNCLRSSEIRQADLFCHRFSLTRQQEELTTAVMDVEAHFLSQFSEIFLLRSLIKG
jgi:hypothetical protein